MHTGQQSPSPAGYAASWYMLAVLLVAYTLSFLDRSLLSLLVAPIKHDLGLSDVRISLLLGFAFAIFYAIMGVPLGLLADRGSRQKLIVFGVTFWSLMTAACGLAGNFWTLFAARIGVGVGEATLSPSAYSMLSDAFPKRQLGRVMALYSIGLPLGSGIALLLGGVVVNAIGKLGKVSLPYLGVLATWRLSFLLIGISGTAVTMLMLTLREPARQVESAEVADESKLGLFAFLRLRAFVIGAHFTGISLFVLVVYGYMAWTPAFLTRTYGLSAEQIGVSYGIITAVCGAGGLLIGGLCADWLFSRGRSDAHLLTILMSVAISWPLFMAMPLMQTAATAFVVLVPMVIASTIHGGIAGAALQLITPNHLRGRVTALYFLAANLVGLGLGPTLVAVLTDDVLHDEAALRYAMVAVSAVIMPLSAIVLTMGLAPFRRAVLSNV